MKTFGQFWRESYKAAKVRRAAPDLLEACKALIREWDEGDVSIDPAVCVHVPNHTDLCPIGLAKQAITKATE